MATAPRVSTIIPAYNAAAFVAKERLLALSDQRISRDGIIIIKAQTHRVQEQNRQEALDRALRTDSLAASGRFQPAPILLGLALLLWMTGFDIIYATQDEDADRQLGLHSIPARLGRARSLRLSAFLHLLVPGLLWSTGWLQGWSLAWNAVCIGIAGLLAWMHLWRKGDDLSMQDGFFKANALVSLVVLVGTFWETVLR